MKITEDKFIELLRKSDNFLLNEAFSKVKNAKVLAVYSKIGEDKENSILFQDPRTKKIYYADYKLTEDTIELSDIQRMEFVNKDYKVDLRSNIENLFSKDYDSNYKNLVSTIKDIINENDETEIRVGRKIDSLMKDEKILHVDKPKYEIKDKKSLKENIEKLRSDKFFGKFLVESEAKFKTPVILEEIDWEKDSGRIFRKKINFKTCEVIKESKYSKRGFTKTALLAKEYWKDSKFRKRIGDLLSEEGDVTKKGSVFCEMYKNITLLNEEDLNEMLSKTLLAVYGTSEIENKLKKIYEAIDKNKKNMLRWQLLQEQPPMEAVPPPAGTPAGTPPPEAEDVSGVAAGEEVPAEEPAGLDVTPDELPTAGEEEETDEDLATEATEEVKIINALLDVVEDVFWNGNQENKELANLIKEIRDMRSAGTFDEDRLSEIFRDLFAVTQQIATSPAEESPTGEELPPEETGAEEMPPEELGAETPGEAPTAPTGPGAGEATPLETYA